MYFSRTTGLASRIELDRHFYKMCAFRLAEVGLNPLYQFAWTPEQLVLAQSVYNEVENVFVLKQAKLQSDVDSLGVDKRNIYFAETEQADKVGWLNKVEA